MRFVSPRPEGNIEVKEKQNSLSPEGPVINPFTPKSDLIDFTLSNANRFYSSKGDPLGVKGFKCLVIPPDSKIEKTPKT